MRSMLPLHRIVSLLVLSALLAGCDAIKFWESDSGVRETMSIAQKEVLDVRNRATTIQSAIDRLDRRDISPFTLGDTTLVISMYFDAGRITSYNVCYTKLLRSNSRRCFNITSCVFPCRCTSRRDPSSPLSPTRKRNMRSATRRSPSATGGHNNFV